MNSRFSRGWQLCVLLLVCLAPLAFSKKKQELPSVRWAEGQKGCTFERGEDGKYRYGLWTDDLGITLAIDSQELQNTHRRQEPMVGVLLSVRYRGTGSFDLQTGGITLEFVKHEHVVHAALDPDALATHLQAGADGLEDEAQRESKKHPDKFEEKEKLLQEYQKQLAEMLQFLGTRSLHPGTLDAATPEVSGWLFVSAKSKWIGDWKKQEDFVLRIPLEKYVVEFPITLPPNEGELLLRRRPE
jgi:hypothetical protein